ncbi:MAG: DNA translocase FtsK 4TM domain-containing protein [Clostridiales bacterium]|nr:DNA translocase FtsK 4TM domain-containing protein [Clostridiales bacterium]
MEDFDNKKEVTGIVLFFFAVAITFMYYLPETVTGFVGAFLRSIGFGLLGSSAFLIPLFLFYAAVDFFLEKREGVSPVRVRSVIIFVICFSALFALFSMDFDYFRSLCTDNVTGKVKASTAISLLWRSGPDSSLITDPAASSNTLTGGLLGGGIAIALNRIMGKVISVMALIVLLLSLIIRVFRISVKNTAKKAARSISQATSRAYDSVRHDRPRQQMRPQYPAVPGQGRPAVPSRYSNNRGSQFVNTPTDISGSPLFDRDPNVDLLNRHRMPVDAKTGFIDVSGQEFGADTSVHHDRLNYGNRQVDIEGADEAPVADFQYTTEPKNPPLRQKKDQKYHSFDEKNPNRQKEFYDLGGSVFPDAQSAPEKQDYPVEPQADDLPYEILDDDDPYNMGSDRYGVPASQNRSPEDFRKSAPAPSHMPRKANEDTDDSGITINAREKNDTGFSSTEGRIIDTGSTSSGPAIHMESAASNQPARKTFRGPYKPAPVNLLSKEDRTQSKESAAELREKAKELESAISSFGINTKVVNITHGPAITRFELTIDRGVKVSKILSLQDDIALAMAAVSVRIEAPIPGKSAIGIEIPNKKTTAVKLRGLLETEQFRKGPSLEVPLGRDIPGNAIMCNIAKMPHLLIAGSTGSGKSVCINTILTSILCKASPDDVRMILIDPKVVELSVYNGIPHLYMPVVTDPKKAAGALKWAVVEMEKRYKCFADSGVRDLNGYNEYLKRNGQKALPLVLIVIDELADLMTVAAKEVEDHISRLAAMARAAGLHLLIATQRPSVDVITGVIKANVPSRIAFAVSSGVDSRTILDSVGAEKLLGKGDMLYAPLSAPKPIRGQGAFLSDNEVSSVVDFLRGKYGHMYDESVIAAVESEANAGSGGGGASAGGGDSGDADDLLEQAVDVVIDAGNASVSILQRRLGIGYPRAARLIDELEKKHYIGPFEGSKPRKVLITKTDWLEIKSKGEA